MSRNRALPRPRFDGKARGRVSTTSLSNLRNPTTQRARRGAAVHCDEPNPKTPCNRFNDAHTRANGPLLP
eukprot:CAMPEP_0179413050 /NCGR_PEP_ID=MMETSP0799-20121207/4852_1 /TAXON_ID=46947 /ORGANISM="Geminigera cryophila, Strain CCMP2564" /LENGTH=69 /DNA_ID=CAMNT_0021185417 /DNA_START=466 /DNA_END=671 /DNA_ORIENTATION=-